MTQPAPSRLTDLLDRLEVRLEQEVEAAEALPIYRSCTGITANVAVLKRLADTARSLAALRTALARLAGLGQARRAPAEAATPADAASASEDAAIEPGLNRHDRRRLERLNAQLSRDRAAA